MEGCFYTLEACWCLGTEDMWYTSKKTSKGADIEVDRKHFKACVIFTLQKNLRELHLSDPR